MIGSASTAETSPAGIRRKPIWRMPVSTVRPNPPMSPRAARRDIVGKSTVATATEKIPCGSM